MITDRKLELQGKIRKDCLPRCYRSWVGQGRAAGRGKQRTARF